MAENETYVSSRLWDKVAFGIKASLWKDLREEPIKGTEAPAKPKIDPRVTKVIMEAKPEPPRRRRLVSTFAEWIVDPQISPAETSDEFTDVLRAVVSDDNPLPIDQVAAMVGTDVARVEALVTNVPLISVDDRGEQKKLDMPDVQDYLGSWKVGAVQNLPADVEPGIVSELLTPLPSYGVEVFSDDRAAD